MLSGLMGALSVRGLEARAPRNPSPARRCAYFGLTLDSKNGAFTISLFSWAMSQPASALAARYFCQSGSAIIAARFVSRSPAFS